MARSKIRTIKPEFYRHEELFQLEKETGLPIRVAFSGLWTVADREGRFEWKPNVLKLDVLPYDEVDFSRVLDALASRGFLVKYRPLSITDTKWYGCVNHFTVHQVINNKELPSKLPDPNDNCEIVDVLYACPTREIHVADDAAESLFLSEAEVEVEVDLEVEMEKNIAMVSKTVVSKNEDEKPLVRAKAISKGKAMGEDEVLDLDGPSPTALTWRAYRDAYRIRHEIAPPWNSRTGGQLKHFISRIPKEEAPLIAAFYLTHNDQTYVRAKHPVGYLLRDAEKLRTEWKTGHKVTSLQARSFEQRDANMDAMKTYLEQKGGTV